MITVADGAKMIVLSAVVLLIPTRTERPSVVLRSLSVVTATALIVSGLGYLTQTSELMAVAYVSLPLLLGWVLVTAWAWGERVERQTDAAVR